MIAILRARAGKTRAFTSAGTSGGTAGGFAGGYRWDQNGERTAAQDARTSTLDALIFAS